MPPSPSGSMISYPPIFAPLFRRTNQPSKATSARGMAMPDYRGRACYSLDVRALQPIGASIAVALLALACQGQPTPSSAADPKDAAIPGARELKVGDVAPDFELPGTDGKTYRLADFRGRQTVVLAWFAKAFTGP